MFPHITKAPKRESETKSDESNFSKNYVFAPLTLFKAQCQCGKSQKNDWISLRSPKRVEINNG